MHVDFHKAIKSFRWHICFKKDRLLNESDFKIRHPGKHLGRESKLHNHCSSEQPWEVLPAEVQVQIPWPLKPSSTETLLQFTAPPNSRLTCLLHFPEKGNTRDIKWALRKPCICPKISPLWVIGRQWDWDEKVPAWFFRSNFRTGRTLRQELVQVS